MHLPGRLRPFRDTCKARTARGAGRVSALAGSARSARASRARRAFGTGACCGARSGLTLRAVARNPDEGVDPFGRLVQAVQQVKLAAPRLEKGAARLDPDF